MKTKILVSLTVDYTGNLEIIKREIERQAKHMNVSGASVVHGPYGLKVDRVEVE